MVYNSESLSNKVYEIAEYYNANDIDICIIQELWCNKNIKAVKTELADFGLEISYD